MGAGPFWRTKCRVVALRKWRCHFEVLVCQVPSRGSWRRFAPETSTGSSSPQGAGRPTRRPSASRGSSPAGRRSSRSTGRAWGRFRLGLFGFLMKTINNQSTGGIQCCFIEQRSRRIDSSSRRYGLRSMRLTVGWGGSFWCCVGCVFFQRFPQKVGWFLQCSQGFLWVFHLVCFWFPFANINPKGGPYFRKGQHVQYPLSSDGQSCS